MCVTAMGGFWHPEHFLCSACGKPVASSRFYEYNGAPYHLGCYARYVAPGCAFCGKPLAECCAVDHWGTKFCAEHWEEFPKCVYCGRLVPQCDLRSPSFVDSVVRCAECRKSAIESADEAQLLSGRIARWLSDEGLDFNGRAITLRLTHPNQIAGSRRDSGPSHTLAATLLETHSCFGIELFTRVRTVAIVYGLPAMLFRAAVAHELGHVWLSVHGISALPDWGEEGFCELLAHRVLTRMNRIVTREAQYYATHIESNQDPTYGDGFRRLQRLTAVLGFRHVVEELRETKHLSRQDV